MYFGIEKLTSDYDEARVVKFYKDHIEDLDVYCVLNSTQTKFRLPVKMKLDENSSPLDGSPLFWRAEIEITKDFFGKDIYINPYIETNINKIFERSSTVYEVLINFMNSTQTCLFSCTKVSS